MEEQKDTKQYFYLVSLAIFIAGTLIAVNVFTTQSFEPSLGDPNAPVIMVFSPLLT